MEKINRIILELENKFAPDRRTAIFHITAGQADTRFILKGETNIPEAKEELIQKLNTAQIVDSINVLPEAGLGDKIYGIINLSVANLRTKSFHQSEMATQALLGTPVKVLKKIKDWFLVQTPDLYISWLEGDGFFRADYSTVLSWNHSKKIIYTNDFGFSYSLPDENSQRVTDLVEGDILKYAGKETGFCKVVYPDGKTAFIKSADCTPFDEWLSKVNPTAENILKTAKLFMGIPYLWGGTSIKGMDCSGFTKTVFFLNGLILPRDASQQADIGEFIDTKNRLENLMPGDLLFFGEKGKDSLKDKIVHVALYIGDGDYINASGKVRINSLSKNKPNYNAYRDDSFICARRVLSISDKNAPDKKQGVSSILYNKFYNELK
ncbi:MAG TPA: C40 family peptidase [Ignavibacteriaceae bacterium]|nr:C40 family peptidase [Ignavibacteriaceae bacterium]